MLKTYARKIIVYINWYFAQKYISKYKPIVIGVVGSIGKTGTKRAIAKVLSKSKNVMWQDGNYNDLVTVPLIFFGLDEPSLFNPFAWLKTYGLMIKKLRSPTGAEVVVLELGTDGPGQIPEFGKYLTLDIAVVTAISHEHMENFDNLESVSREELSVSAFSNKIYINSNYSEHVLKSGISNFEFYGEKSSDELTFKFSNDNHVIITIGSSVIKVIPNLIGSHQYYALTVAAALATNIGLTNPQIIEAINNLSAMPGRMNPLKGKDGSLIIDDTYNSSPDAVKAALDYLAKSNYKNRIAVLGSMNEMGQYSNSLHSMIGKYCSPKNISLVITLGEDANMYIAKEAKKNGCKTICFESPYEIGNYLNNTDLHNTAILFKGSQNKIFLEEAIKSILQNKNDTKLLVRQSDKWLLTKNKQFGKTIE